MNSKYQHINFSLFSHSSNQIVSEASTSFEILVVKLQRGREREIHRTTFTNPSSNLVKSTYQFWKSWIRLKTRKQSDLGPIKKVFVKAINVRFEPRIGQRRMWKAQFVHFIVYSKKFLKGKETENWVSKIFCPGMAPLTPSWKNPRPLLGCWCCNV